MILAVAAHRLDAAPGVGLVGPSGLFDTEVIRRIRADSRWARLPPSDLSPVLRARQSWQMGRFGASRLVRNHSTLRRALRRTIRWCVLPRLAHGVSHELRAAVRPQVSGNAADAHQPAQNLDNARRADAPGNVDGQTFAGELVDNRETFELLAVDARVEHEVAGPDVVGCQRLQRPGMADRKVSSRPLPRQPKSSLPPEPSRPVKARGITFPPQEDANPLITVPGLPGGKSSHRRDHRPLPGIR